MLRIRLARTGRRNQPKFRLVVAEKARAVKGKFISVLGHYIPVGNKPFVVNKEAVLEWMKKGAQPSSSVAVLLKKVAGMEGMDKFITRRMDKKRSKKKAEAGAETSPSAKKESVAAEKTV